jgi:hypothetical protein
MDSATLMAWIRVESVHDLCNSFLMSTKDNVGQLHWQIRSADGAVGVSVRGDPAASLYETTPAFDRDHRSVWRHVAVVYDRNAAKARIYTDGNMTGEAEIGRLMPIQIGVAWIGNWDAKYKSSRDNIRNLIGSIDELAIFARPLKTEEIQRMYEEEIGLAKESSISTKCEKLNRPQREDSEKR